MRTGAVVKALSARAVVSLVTVLLVACTGSPNSTTATPTPAVPIAVATVAPTSHLPPAHPDPTPVATDTAALTTPAAAATARPATATAAPPAPTATPRGTATSSPRAKPGEWPITITGVVGNVAADGSAVTFAEPVHGIPGVLLTPASEIVAVDGSEGTVKDLEQGVVIQVGASPGGSGPPIAGRITVVSRPGASLPSP